MKLNYSLKNLCMNGLKTLNQITKKKIFIKFILIFQEIDLKIIESRAKEMIKKGAISEVRNLLKLKISKNKSVNKAIGINEIKRISCEKKFKLMKLLKKYQ